MSWMDHHPCAPLPSLAHYATFSSRAGLSRSIERITEKLGAPRLYREVEAVLTGRLKHRANYLERIIHPDTRGEVRAYFEREAGRIAAAHAVHADPARHVRGANPVASAGVRPPASRPLRRHDRSRLGGASARSARKFFTKAADYKAAVVKLSVGDPIGCGAHLCALSTRGHSARQSRIRRGGTGRS